MTAPSLGAGSARDVEEVLWRAYATWLTEPGADADDLVPGLATAVLASDWLAAHVARAVTADRERVAALIRSWPYSTTPGGTRVVDMTVDEALASLAAPHVEPSP